MNHIVSMAAVLLLGMLAVMAGVYYQDRQQGAAFAIRESLAWGSGFFLALGAELLLFIDVL